MSSWRPLSSGTRVKHRQDGYEGWIHGTSVCIQGTEVNPDGRSQYRTVHFGDDGKEIKLAPEQHLATCQNNNLPGDVEVARADDADFSITCTVWALGKYHARQQLGDVRSRTRESLKHTDMISSLKRGQREAVEYFSDYLDRVLGNSLSISIVPSSNPNYPNKGLIGLVRKLTARNRQDASSCLRRFQEVYPSHLGEWRTDVSRHLNSILVENEHLIANRVVLLLDDIVTTGTSMLSCKKLLLERGVSKVMSLALGKSTW
jgi:predicted amidophosphoribosyltransferase